MRKKIQPIPPPRSLQASLSGAWPRTGDPSLPRRMRSGSHENGHPAPKTPGHPNRPSSGQAICSGEWERWSTGCFSNCARRKVSISTGTTLRAALRQEGLDGRKLDEALSRAVSALTNTVRDERGRWILSLHQEDQREYALSTVVQGRVRRYVLDRTFVAGGTRWIIDYKTGSHAGGSPEDFLDNEQARYRTQLETYGSLVRSMDSRPIRLGLYFPMLQGWREWAYPG